MHAEWKLQGKDVNHDMDNGASSTPSEPGGSGADGEPPQKPSPIARTQPGEGATRHAASLKPQTSAQASPAVTSHTTPPVAHTAKKQTSVLGRLKRLFGKKSGNEAVSESISAVLSSQAVAEMKFSSEERDMLHSILELRNMRVEDIMVARADIIAVDIRTPLGELLKRFEESGHSRMPVHDDGLDDPKGMVHIRDVLTHLSSAAAVPEDEVGTLTNPDQAGLDLTRIDLSTPMQDLKIVRPVLFVPPSMPAIDLMGRMQANRLQMALVIDEYGGTDGLVCLEDIVEVIVGDIEDEHDEEDHNLIEDGGNGVFRVNARTELDDLRNALGHAVDVGDLDEGVDTIGGLIFALLGRIPVRGEVIDAFGFEIRIIDADPRRIRTIEIAPLDGKKLKPEKPVGGTGSPVDKEQNSSPATPTS